MKKTVSDINKSIVQEDRVPKLFKTARKIPLYKKDLANKCGNYRTFKLSKILEAASSLRGICLYIYGTVEIEEIKII